MLRPYILVAALLVQGITLVAPSAQAQSYPPPERSQPETSACAYAPGDRAGWRSPYHGVPDHLCAFIPPNRGMPGRTGAGGTR
jgi:hypothetical protein